MDQEVSDIILFFGRFHPIVLHLPIGFLALAFLLEMMSRLARFRQYQPAVEVALLLGAGSAVAAAGLGYMLAQGGGYSEDLLDLHQWLGIGAAATAVVSFFLMRSARQGAPIMDKVYLGVFSVTMLVLTGAGHYGGSLTHGSDYLTKYMPDPLRALAGLPPKENKEAKKITNINEAVVYTDIVHPILEARCVSCHNDEKKKGELMMHTVQALQAGGESGPVFVAGNAEESAMMQRIHLPMADEEHMPPDGKSQLSDEQVVLLTWWIEQGGSFDKTVAELTVDDETQMALATLADPDANKTEVEKLLSSDVPAIDPQIAQALWASGVSVIPLAAEVGWLQAKASSANAIDTILNQPAPVAEQITWLDLGNTEVTDEMIQALPKFKHLTRLHLENTKVSDAGLVSLKNLAYLEYLNLYGTAVSDKGLAELAELKNLRRLYLWQTNATADGAAQLQERIPGLDINLGAGTTPDDSVQTAGRPSADLETTQES